jgi:SAM-dependent methyltransferase
MTVTHRPTKLAYEAVPSHRLYCLRLARYKAMAESIGEYVERGRPRGRADGEPLKLLDVGPGSGRSLAFLEREGFAERLKFHGIDFSERRLGTIYKPDDWQLTRADITLGLPYAPESFDICVCEQVLEHLPRPAETVAEIVRVLRPGGLMIVGVPTFPPGIATLRTLGVGLLERAFGWKRGHVQTFTSRRVKMLMAQHPLRLIACRGFRIASGGPLSRLEDRFWWYRLNRQIGQAVPWLCTEVQLVLSKTNSDESRHGMSMLRAAG